MTNQSRFSRVLGGDGGEDFLTLEKLGVEVRCVCARCNNGWMAELEARVKPLVTPMIRGAQPVILNIGDQEVLALWCVKTAMMFERTERDNLFIPTDHHRWVYENRTPPPSTSVALAAYRGGHWDVPTIHFFSIISPRATDQRPDGYCMMLRFDRFIAMTTGFYVDRDFELAQVGTLRDLLVPIWPIRGVQSWPPPVFVDGQGVEGFLHGAITDDPALGRPRLKEVGIDSVMPYHPAGWKPPRR